MNSSPSDMGSSTCSFRRFAVSCVSVSVIALLVTLGVAPNRHSPVSRWLRSSGLITGNPMYDTMEELKGISNRFYIYEDAIISQSQLIDEFRAMGDAAFTSSLDHIKADSDGEKLILEALENHPLRTSNPDEAELFIVPTPITELLAYGCQWENCTWYDDAFRALSKHPVFIETQGHNHVIIALSWPTFNKRYSAFVPALSRNYRRLENVTVAHDYDPFGCMELGESKKDNALNDFDRIYESESPVVNAVSLGLGFNDPFPLRTPSFQKFKTSDYFLFYHSRERSFAYGSTKYRNAPLDEAVIEKLPPSSIGHDVPFDEWVHGFTSSKFCLVVRGDTPHSHSLLYAVRAGCIPVVVSDDYPLYAPPFKSSIAIDDFAIFIKEEDFVADPVQQLLKLQDLPETFVRTKLDNLSAVQTIAIADHSESLFVPALLKEVMKAEKNGVLSSKPQVAFRDDHAILSGWTFLYRYPSTLSDVSDSSFNVHDEPILIVGVLSESQNFNARHAIRGTWASERPHHGVFFVVAGPWKNIEQEFLDYGDLIWLNMDEDSTLTTNKVQLLLHAINKHVDSYDYVIKTNEDSYVWLEDVKHHLKSSKPGYWGNCSNDSPHHAHGMGYALSREFNECATSHIESIGVMSAKEDIATGRLAELCGVTCNDEGWDWWMDPMGKRLEFIKGEVNNTGAMLFMHWYVLSQQGGWEA